MTGQTKQSNLVEQLCYATIISLTVITQLYYQFVPLHINITCFSLAIIIAGSNRSVYQLINEFKVVRDKKEESQIE